MILPKSPIYNIRCKRPIKKGRLVYVGENGYAIQTKNDLLIGKAVDDSKPFEGHHLVRVRIA